MLFPRISSIKARASITKIPISHQNLMATEYDINILYSFFITSKAKISKNLDYYFLDLLSRLIRNIIS